MTELIICEKPAAANKVANALGKATKLAEKGVPYYSVNHNGQDILVGCAVGHIYTLTETNGKTWEYPIFDIKWEQSSKVDKGAKFTSKYVTTLKKLAKKCDTFTVACDYDIEGEVIGINALRYACKQKDANRMKFSTLTKKDLVDAYENKSPTIDWGQAEAGITRHKLDWYYGINLSRALMDAIKTTGKFKVMSIGRVQGPALKMVVDKEKSIQAFIPVPYWQIELITKEGPLTAMHVEDKFMDKKKADKTYSVVKYEKKTMVDQVKKRKFKQAPPVPFDLTSLQVEAHKTLRIAPKKTLEIAQELYTKSYISYPRTSSQKLSEKLGLKKIIQELQKINLFKKECTFLLGKKVLKPNEGKKDDPAHPAIHPTGEMPKDLDKQQMDLYELIARRFLACFGDDAIRETMEIILDIKNEKFNTKGTVTVEKGWHELYGRFVMLKEEQLPEMTKGTELNVSKISLLDKETSPPKRYTESSIIKSLEKRNLGTKATRATIVDTLFNRGYLDGKQIKATVFGIKTVDTLQKYSPGILEEEMTREFEEDMELIREGKKKEEQVLDKAKKHLIKVLDEFKKHKKEIGSDLVEANLEARKIEAQIGPCNLCDGNLRIISTKKGRFVACDKYPDCENHFNIPNTGLIKASGNICDACGIPKVLVIRKGKRPQEVCINPKCPSKEQVDESKLEARKCPKCGKDMILRQSIYGKFWGCSGYPKCKTIEKLK